MKKYSLLTIAAASMLGLVACGNQPAPAPARTVESVAARVAEVGLDLEKPAVKNEDYFVFKDGFAGYQDGVNLDVTAENPYVALCQDVTTKLANGISYLRVAIQPTAYTSGNSAYSRLGTADDSGAFWIDIDTSADPTTPSKGYWQFYVYGNPYSQGSAPSELLPIYRMQSHGCCISLQAVL